jgi:hypothetical protein
MTGYARNARFTLAEKTSMPGRAPPGSWLHLVCCLRARRLLRQLPGLRYLPPHLSLAASEELA